MICGGCAARRRRIREAARRKALVPLAGELAKGAAELAGLKRKTALEEDRKDAGRAARLARRASPPGAWPTQ